MKCTAHGFTWELKESQLGLFSGLQQEGAPHIEVAAIILATGVLPESMTARPVPRPVDDLGAWIKVRRWMNNERPFIFAEDEKRSIWSAKEGEDRLRMMGRFIKGTRAPTGAVATQLVEMGWIRPTPMGLVVGDGYYTHIGSMILALIARDGPCGTRYITDNLSEELLIVESALSDLERKGKVEYSRPHGAWHLI